jgi:hypothetical protein
LGIGNELLEMLEGQLFGVFIFSPGFFGIDRLRGLHLACSVEKSSWGFLVAQ